MTGKSIYNPSKSILLKKGVHRNIPIIWLRFSGRRDWLPKVKSLAEIKYSRTHSTWYLPYSKKNYNQFLQLQIPYTISGTHQEQNESTGRVEPEDDKTGICLKKEAATVRPSSTKVGTDIHSSPKMRVTWNHKSFAITLPYVIGSIRLLKQLEGAWWNEKGKLWICKSTLANLEKIQRYWKIFSDDEYQSWYAKVASVTNPCKLILFYSPKHEGNVCIQLVGYGVNHQIVKQQSGRNWYKEGKYYTVPYKTKVVETIIKEYESIGYKIEKRLPEFVDKQKARTGASSIAFFLKKIPKEQYSFLKSYTDTMLRQNYGLKTIKSYAGKLVTLLNYLNKKTMGDVQADEVNQYLSMLIEKDVSYSLVNQVYSAIKIYSDKVAMDDSFEMKKLKRPRKSRRLPVFLSEGEVLRIIDQIDNIKHLCVFYLLYGAGLRRSEVINLELKDIYWDRNQIRINNSKGQKDRIVNLSQETKAIMDVYFTTKKPVRYLIEGRTAGTKYSETSVAAIVKTASQKAKITKKVTPHSMRHSFATHMMDRGVPLPKIQALLGHKDIKTTLIYTHLTNKDLSKVDSPLDVILKNRNRDIKK